MVHRAQVASLEEERRANAAKRAEAKGAELAELHAELRRVRARNGDQGEQTLKWKQIRARISELEAS
jgi:hypothetical protein